MKPFIISAVSCCSVFFLMLGGALAADCTSSVSQDEALKAEDARYTAQTTGDFNALKTLFADDLIYTHSSGIVDTKAGYIGKQSTGALVYKTMKRSNVKVRIVDCIAVITGTGSFDVSVSGQVSTFDLVFHSIWMKRGSQLQFISFQSTPTPRKP